MASKEANQRDEMIGLEQTPIPDELRELQTELINLNTKLVFAVATCDCENKEDCEIYEISKDVAKVLKKIQDVVSPIQKVKGSKKGKKS